MISLIFLLLVGWGLVNVLTVIAYIIGMILGIASKK